MKALLYLTKRSFINNLKKAVKKPASLLVMIICIVYGSGGGYVEETFIVLGFVGFGVCIQDYDFVEF